MISIIIPVFNAEQCLRRCLDSVKAQTYTDFEAIVVNDGSTDSSGLICDEYASIDNRFRVVHQPNQGVSAARNLGLDLASGDYIYFADCDDELRPEALEHLYDAIQRGEYDVAASGYTLVNSSDEKDCCMVTGAAPYAYSGYDLLVNLLQQGDFIFYTCWNKLISKQLVAELRFRNIKQEDFLFCGQLYLRLQSLIYLNESLYVYYYDQPSSLSKCFSYIGPHQTVTVMSLLLEDVPKEKRNVRGFILAKMFRRLITSSFFVTDWPLSMSEKDEFRESCKSIFKKYHAEYFFHPSISLIDKMKVASARLFPWLFSRYIKRIAVKS